MSSFMSARLMSSDVASRTSLSTASLKPTPPEPPKPAPPEKPLEVAKEEPKKPQPPTPEKAASDFDALLASVEAQAKRVKEPEKRQAKGAAAERGGTNSPGDAQQAQANPSALIAAISQQVTPCWNIPLAAQGAGSAPQPRPPHWLSLR